MVQFTARPRTVVQTKKLNTRWFTGVEDSERASREELIRNSRTVLATLTDTIDREIAALSNTTNDDYETPAWACKQADRNGQIRALKKLRLMTALT